MATRKTIRSKRRAGNAAGARKRLAVTWAHVDLKRIPHEGELTPDEVQRGIDRIELWCRHARSTLRGDSKWHPRVLKAVREMNAAIDALREHAPKRHTDLRNMVVRYVLTNLEHGTDETPAAHAKWAVIFAKDVSRELATRLADSEQVSAAISKWPDRRRVISSITGILDGRAAPRRRTQPRDDERSYDAWLKLRAKLVGN